MTRLAFFLVVFGGLLAAARGATAAVERDVGNGLVYVRVHQLPADLPPKPAGRVPPCVIDVRYLEADADAAKAFGAWLKFRATPRSPVFVLANGGTAPALLEIVAAHDKGTGIAVVGIETARFHPDVPVKSTAEDERRAYDALEKGAELATLLADNPRKVRNDEASLNRDRPATPLPPVNDDGPGAESAARPVIDATLQRAVHLHRALVAMKKI